MIKYITDTGALNSVTSPHLGVSEFKKQVPHSEVAVFLYHQPPLYFPAQFTPSFPSFSRSLIENPVPMVKHPSSKLKSVSPCNGVIL